jgi:diketogulonate reductase-like aldo/keto reductase
LYYNWNLLYLKEVERSPSQLLIRWSVQHGVVTIPKSKNLARLAENSEIWDFALSQEQMKLLDSLHTNLRVSWDPSDCP